MRAVAVLAVVGFHFGLGWLQGGFFGVDVFYVLSGFLITSLLVAEYRRRDTIKLAAFWMRRARRLLPALFLVLIATTLCVRLLSAAGTYPDYRMDALSALFYFSNWFQIAVSGNYFVANGPVQPLTHTWSLAIEEQFYLVWPLVVLAVMHLARRYRRGVKVLLGLSVTGCLASAAEMALLYNPSANTTRLYFGTDTHAQSILVGAALASAMALRQGARRPRHAASTRGAVGWLARGALALSGAAGLGILVWLSVSATGTEAFTYQGGFLVCDVATAALLLSVLAAPRGAVSRLLSLRPLVALGLISYGVYLWHFPVSVFVTSSRTGIGGIRLQALQFALTIAASTASFLLVERPILRGTFWRRLRSLVPAGAGIAATFLVIWVGGAVPMAAASAHAQHFKLSTKASPAAAPPARVVVLGDSTALTLALALHATAPAGTTVSNDGLYGCGLAVAANYSNEFRPENPMFPACLEGEPADKLWPDLDRASVQGTGPGDLVVFWSGHWETQDLLIDGHWTDILLRSFRQYLAHQLDTLIGIATAHGAHLDLLTMPAMERSYPWLGSSPEAYDISSSPARRRIYNSLLSRAAATHPASVSLVDACSILSPRGRFTRVLDGVQVRSGDGVHTPAYAPGDPFDDNASEAAADAFYNWISPRLWPLLVSSAHGFSSAHGRVTTDPPGAGC
jgi:peptidoglycan/LPS O-acetylase OafA/YrhL